MIMSRVTPPTEVEGAKEDGAEGVGGVAVPKLCLTPFNGSVVNGTHNGEVVVRGKRNRKMA